ncbi:radical SAM protein, partial [bacterium]|nr:radical SAM protein [bacterium]
KNTCEIVLTGINMSSYGKDISVTLTDLIRRLADYDVRIRLGSFYAEAINIELLDALFSLKKFCPHFHLSLQSGDDSVLKAMRRKYTTNDYKKAIDLIRSYDSNAAITTDIIVGFPTEREENFAATTNFITRIGFSDIHIFPFSAREGTVAYSYPVLPAEVVGRRKEILTDIKKKAIKQYLSKNIGIAQEVLIEKNSGEYCEGYSRYYIKTYTKQEGTLVNVKPTAIFKDGLKE